MVRTRIEVQEQTQVGDALVRGLMRAQLGLALRLAAVVVSIVAAVVLFTTAAPELASLSVFGIRLNWLILAGLIYPLLYGVDGSTSGWPSRASGTSSAWSTANHDRLSPDRCRAAVRGRGDHRDRRLRREVLAHHIGLPGGLAQRRVTLERRGDLG